MMRIETARKSLASLEDEFNKIERENNIERARCDAINILSRAPFTLSKINDIEDITYFIHPTYSTLSDEERKEGFYVPFTEYCRLKDEHHANRGEPRCLS